MIRIRIKKRNEIFKYKGTLKGRPTIFLRDLEHIISISRNSPEFIKRAIEDIEKNDSVRPLYLYDKDTPREGRMYTISSIDK